MFDKDKQLRCKYSEPFVNNRNFGVVIKVTSTVQKQHMRYKAIT